MALTAPQFWQAALVIGVTDDSMAQELLNQKSPMIIQKDEDRESVLIDIKKTTQFDRHHYLIESMAKPKNMPDAQLDSLWNWDLQMQ